VNNTSLPPAPPKPERPGFSTNATEKIYELERIACALERLVQIAEVLATRVLSKS
jgi:hypothetical protein